MALTDAPVFTAQYYGDSGGAVTYYYWLQIKYATGDTALFTPIPASVTVSGLTHSNVVSLNWTPMPGAVNYSVFRNTANTPPTLGSATALCIAGNYATANGLVDNGITPLATFTPPATAVH